MDEIPYELTIEERYAYLCACVRADSVSFEMIIEYTNKIIQRLRSSKLRRLLIINESPMLASTDSYLIASYIVKNAIPGNVRVAVVDRAPDYSRKQEQISLVSRAAGLNMRTFADFDEGEKWLISGDNGMSNGAH